MQQQQWTLVLFPQRNRRLLVVQCDVSLGPEHTHASSARVDRTSVTDWVTLNDFVAWLYQFSSFPHGIVVAVMHGSTDPVQAEYLRRDIEMLHGGKGSELRLSMHTSSLERQDQLVEQFGRQNLELLIAMDAIRLL